LCRSIESEKKVEYRNRQRDAIAIALIRKRVEWIDDDHGNVVELLQERRVSNPDEYQVATTPMTGIRADERISRRVMDELPR